MSIQERLRDAEARAADWEATASNLSRAANREADENKRLRAALDAKDAEIRGRDFAIYALEAEIERLREVLTGFRNIAFRPCQDPACYRPTLTMMQTANRALSTPILRDDDKPSEGAGPERKD